MSKNIIEKTKIPPKVIIVTTFEEVDNVINLLEQNIPVILNAAQMKERNGYRIIDFISGYCYARNGEYKKIDDRIYRFEI